MADSQENNSSGSTTVTSGGNASVNGATASSEGSTVSGTGESATSSSTVNHNGYTGVSASGSTSGANTAGNVVSGATVVTNTGRGPRNSGVYPAPPGGADRGVVEGPDTDPIPKPLPLYRTFILHNKTGTYLSKNAVVAIESATGGGCIVTMWDGRFFTFAESPKTMASKIGNTLDANEGSQTSEYSYDIPTSGGGSRTINTADSDGASS